MLRDPIDEEPIDDGTRWLHMAGGLHTGSCVFVLVRVCVCRGAGASELACVRAGVRACVGLCVRPWACLVVSVQGGGAG